MLASLSRGFFLTLADSASLKRLASRYGMRGREGFARRFIGGETLDEAIETASQLERRGLLHTLNHLGEHVRTVAKAEAATVEYLTIIERVRSARLTCNLSLKLTQLGLELDRATAATNLRRILEAAEQGHGFVRIDMENSPIVSATLELFETLWQQGHRNVGVVLQAALYRSADDLRRMNALGARVRLVKGAYKEPERVAYQQKAAVDAAFLRLMCGLLQDGAYPAIATHDPKMIQAGCAFAREHGISTDRFEFQMLYGVRRDLQASLHAQGYRLRIYLPFGHEWFPYFMRRLAERPANVAFVIKGVLHEHVGQGQAFGKH